MRNLDRNSASGDFSTQCSCIERPESRTIDQRHIGGNACQHGLRAEAPYERLFAGCQTSFVDDQFSNRHQRKLGKDRIKRQPRQSRRTKGYSSE